MNNSNLPQENIELEWQKDEAKKDKIGFQKKTIKDERDILPPPLRGNRLHKGF